MNATELQSRVKVFYDAGYGAPRVHTWSHHRRALCDHIMAGKESIDNFLMWSTIHATMFVGEGTSANNMYRVLNGTKWIARAIEDDLGHPPRLSYAPFTSGNMIAQAYHLMQFETMSGLDVSSMKSIVEFGGGYGAMAKLIRRSGFRGSYVIYDFPEFCLLQEYYLSNLGINDITFCTGDIDNLPDTSVRPDLLICCYSISEAPEVIRQKFLDKVRPHNFLIAHQDAYDGYSITDVMNKIMLKSGEDYLWNTRPNPNYPGHRYVVGVEE